MMSYLQHVANVEQRGRDFGESGMRSEVLSAGILLKTCGTHNASTEIHHETNKIDEQRVELEWRDVIKICYGK